MARADIIVHDGRAARLRMGGTFRDRVEGLAL